MSNIIRKLQSSSNAAVRLMISDKNWLESAAVEQLLKTAELPAMRCAVGMPDLHPGKGQPIGAAFVSCNRIYPHLVDSDIGCGMGLWLLAKPARQVKLDRWEKKLTGLDEPWEGNGDDWLASQGIAPADVSLPPANTALGTIGGGNHFAEIQVVNEVFSNVVFASTGLNPQAVVLLVHSGSRGLGQTILRQHVDVHRAQGLPVNANIGSQEAPVEYLRKHDYAVRWAVANRDLIAERFCQRLGVKREPLLDVAHNTVQRLDEASAIGLGLSADAEESYWIHRKGASPTDQGLVMIPGSRGSLSYLVMPRGGDLARLAQGAYSLAHGAGRKWKRSDARGKLERHYKAKDLAVTNLGGRVICKQRGLLYEEAPQAYKNIDVVVDDLVQAGMIELIASFKPIITYKTRRA